MDTHGCHIFCYLLGHFSGDVRSAGLAPRHAMCQFVVPRTSLLATSLPLPLLCLRTVYVLLREKTLKAREKRQHCNAIIDHRPACCCCACSTYHCLSYRYTDKYVVRTYERLLLAFLGAYIVSTCSCTAFLLALYSNISTSIGSRTFLHDCPGN